MFYLHVFGQLLTSTRRYIKRYYLYRYLLKNIKMAIISFDVYSRSLLLVCFLFIFKQHTTNMTSCYCCVGETCGNIQTCLQKRRISRHPLVNSLSTILQICHCWTVIIGYLRPNFLKGK